MAPIADDAEALSAWARNQRSQAVSVFRSGEPQRALALIGEVLRQVPGEQNAVEIGALIAEQAGALRDAGRYLSMLMANDPPSSTHRRALANILIRAGRHKAATDVLEPALVADPVGSGVLEDYLAALAASPDGERSGRLLDRLAEGIGSPPRLSRIIQLADTLVKLDVPEIAIAWFERDWTALGQRADFLFAKARFLYAQNRYRDAEPIFAGLVDWDAPRRYEVYLFLARIARQLRDEEAARANYLAAYALRPDSEECLNFLIRHHLDRRELAAAHDFLTKFEAAVPGSRHIPWARAALAHADGDTDGAIAIYREAIAADPQFVPNYCNLADHLWNRGAYDDMAAVLEAGAVHEPDSPRLLVRMVRCAEKRGGTAEERLALCERMLQGEPSSEFAMRERANLLLRIGRRREALAQFLAASRIHPDNVLFWRSAAAIAYGHRLYDEVAALLTRAKQQFGSGSADHLAAYAEILEASGRGKDAIVNAQRALTIDPGQARAHDVLSRLFVADGAYGRAWPHLIALQATHPRPIASVRTLAQVAAAFRAVRPTQSDLVAVEPLDGKFPDLVFEEAVGRAAIQDACDCRPLIFQVTSTLAAGGAERQVALTCEAFSQVPSGLAVTLIAEDLSAENHRDFFLPIVERAGVPVHTLNALHAGAAWRELIAESPELRADIRTLSALPRQAQRIALPLYVLLIRHRPQIVHLWQDMIAVAGGLAAVLAGVPRVVFGTRSTRPVEFQRARPFFHGAYRAMLRRPGISMVGNSANGARDYEDWLGLPEGSVAVVPNACDLNAIAANSSAAETPRIRESLGIPDGAPVLGGVMRCSYEKRPELWTAVAIDLAQRDPRFHGILAGDGPMLPELVGQVAQAGLADRIHFVGRQSPIEPWMQAMDVLFLSSLTEGLPNVLIEAQALGVAVATLRVGGAPEAVSEGRSALVIDEAPVPELSTQVGELLNSPAWRARLAEAGPALARERFSPHAVIRQFAGIYGIAG